MKDITIERTIN